ncbi:alpha/beta hydrolase [Roseomonas stagni]|uniref:Alpha/beta hydrolase n=1 Tax=Falsiroseomonas algicola TaxID=2716930 RepID=A0A6M1LUZ5_9PROT|nr:alpha/beta hydrolase [Falsiroseomonas algicola]NGM24325.1 alpha/beta hydrolase [Falsiroseomonas algicola]
MTDQPRRITFRNGPIEIVGALWLPPGFDVGTTHPALVVVTPGSSVKEQIGANYASRMAGRGHVVLTFDPSYQGESGGEPRDLEDPAARMEDVRCALDRLVTLPFVDAERIGVLGICAGGGYAVGTALTERRIKAVGTVVGNNIGRAFRRMQAEAGTTESLLAAVAAARTAEARGAVPRRDPWIPDSPAEAAAVGLSDEATLQAVDYYRTPRGQHPQSTNRLLFRSHALLLGFDAFHLVPELLVQPLAVVIGGVPGSTGSGEEGRRLWELAPNRRDLVVIEGAGHYDLYDRPAFVEQAVSRLDTFFKACLSRS